ncbi:MAG: SDR family oxidoreductase [Eubacterium sp.]|nr:SDR family oxidoreductase [Eubacterium sp.]
MQGKNILITGASKGIGHGVAEYLLQGGANVILVARNREKLEELRLKYPNSAFPYPYDLCKMDGIEDIFLFCKAHGLKLHGMLHAAGISIDRPIKALEFEEMGQVFQVNYFSYVALTKYFLNRKYSENGSSIICMSSMASFECAKAMSQYAASKNAINAYTKVLAREAEKRKIRVNAIAPALVDTDMTHQLCDVLEDFEETLITRQPFGIIPVEQIAYLAEFLLSDRSAYITGAIIPVHGGAF